MRAQDFPAAFRQEIEALLGSESAAFFESYERPHCRALRLNARAGLGGAQDFPALAISGGTDFSAAIKLAGAFVNSPVEWQTGAYRIEGDAMPGSSIMHLLGLYYMQEPSAMSAGAALNVKPGMRVLDLCAAPGGKSSQLAAALGGRGLLVSNEPIQSRAQMLASNIERQGFSNVVVTNEYPDKLAARWGETFDAILVDAPCSGEGMFRRDDEVVRQWSPDAPRMCHERQAGILDSAYAMLRPGGAIVYSTCTFNRIENEESVSDFLKRHADMQTEDFTLPGIGASRDGMMRVWPHRINGEGHFVCRMRKEGRYEDGDAKRAKRRRAGKSACTKPDAADVLKRLKETIELPDIHGAPVMYGQRLYMLPEGCPELSGVRVARAGLEMCEAGRSHVEPAYALGRALAPGRYSVSASTADAIRLIRGESIEADGCSGWVLVNWQGLPVCFGKAHGGIIKSHFPKGLKPLGTLTEEAK